MELSRAVFNVEVEAECSSLQPLDARVLYCPQVSIIENTKKWFMISDDGKFRAAKDKHFGSFKGPTNSQSFAFCWGIATLCTIS